MPKNTGPGGKKFKKIKHNLEAGKRPMVYAEEDQKYALVTKLLGNGRVNVTFIREKVGQIEALAIIRGTLRKKKQWVKVGNYILISERDYEKEKVDVIHVYNEGEMNELKKKGLINESLANLKDSSGEKIKDDEFNDFIDMDDEPELDKKERRYQKTERGGSIIKQDFGIISSSEEESEEESDNENDNENSNDNN